MRRKHTPLAGVIALATLLSATGCGMVGGGLPGDLFGTRPDSTSRATQRAAMRDDDRRIIISLEERRLWLVEGRDTLMAAPIAIGRGETFRYKGNTYNFRTPRGERKVLAKKVDPTWVPPAWHYYEKAANRGLEVVKMERGRKYELSDGTHLEIRGDQVGRVNRFGNFRAWTPGMELIFDGKIFVPPFDTVQRRIPNALGPYALDLGDGYLIHGTWSGNRDSVGSAASHGCIRMYNDDIEKLYSMVGVGTPVYIH